MRPSNFVPIATRPPQHDSTLAHWQSRYNARTMATKRFAITMGDPAGVGPEVALRMFAEQSWGDACQPLLFGDAAVLRRVAEACGLELPATILSYDQWLRGGLENNKATIVDFNAIDAASVTPGQVNAATGRAAYRYVEAAIAAALSHQVAGIVTGPINKEALQLAGIEHPGHTEILAAQTGTDRYCMMLTSDELTCSFVTSHVGYRQVAELLTAERILEVIELSQQALQPLHREPIRIVVCGLNPHAGEHGLFGEQEEERIIAPAIAMARDRGIDAIGPVPPDTAFLPAERRRTHCYVCMYHDQGLIPLKTLAFDTAVNVTLGLPIVRTSVDHGTALDIAWQGVASSTSLTEAFRLAIKLSAGNCSG